MAFLRGIVSFKKLYDCWRDDIRKSGRLLRYIYAYDKGSIELIRENCYDIKII